MPSEHLFRRKRAPEAELPYVLAFDALLILLNNRLNHVRCSHHTLCRRMCSREVHAWHVICGQHEVSQSRTSYASRVKLPGPISVLGVSSKPINRSAIPPQRHPGAITIYARFVLPYRLDETSWQ